MAKVYLFFLLCVHCGHPADVPCGHPETQADRAATNLDFAREDLTPDDEIKLGPDRDHFCLQATFSISHFHLIPPQVPLVSLLASLVPPLPALDK